MWGEYEAKHCFSVVRTVYKENMRALLSPGKRDRIAKHVFYVKKVRVQFQQVLLRLKNSITISYNKCNYQKIITRTALFILIRIYTDLCPSNLSIKLFWAKIIRYDTLLI